MFSGKGGEDFSGYMPAGREGKRAAPFVSLLPPLIFHGAGGRGGAGFDGSLPFRRYMREGREGKLSEPFPFAPPPMNFPERGGKGERILVDLHA